MKQIRIGRTITLLMLGGLLLAGCSNKGVHMKKHRKQRHCDCPTFSMRTTTPTEDDAPRV